MRSIKTRSGRYNCKKFTMEVITVQEVSKVQTGTERDVMVN